MNKELYELLEKAINDCPMPNYHYDKAIRQYHNFITMKKKGRPSKVKYFMQQIRETKGQISVNMNGGGKLKQTPATVMILKLAKKELSKRSYSRLISKLKDEGLL